MGSEYRIRWRRESDDGFPDQRPPRYKIYQKRKDAERWAAILQGRILEFDGIDPDDYACCSGHECGCRGITEGERVAEQMAKVPPLIEGPTLQVREVGDWANAEPALSEAPVDPSSTPSRGQSNDSPRAR